MKVTITKDAKKLWSCRGMQRSQGENNGKLPKASGESLTILLPAQPSTFCEGVMWNTPEEESVRYDTAKRNWTKVCEHQVDFASLADEQKARSYFTAAAD